MNSNTIEPLLAEELIDDRALQAAGDDAFRLTDFVAELVALCETTTLPANIALFGAWGSGKSSLANLLGAEFADGNHRTVAFARFDAFKYAGASLRRHLLSQIAKAFDIENEKYSTGLYTSKKTNQYHMPLKKLKAFGTLIALVTLGVAAFVVVAAAIVGIIGATGSKGSFWVSFAKALESGIPAIIIGSGLFSALVALAGETFTLESTQAAPSTEEEFDRLFRDLASDIVRQKKCERIVIFIDELDRCSPSQVAMMLETIRTFLDISPCVFVVAADQQVVERALTESARQTTPHDTVNPYYSAGSAYLDKIFQHQLALPPLLPRTLSQFALNLIADRPGIWQQIANKPELVTVLVPSHVRSPRRAKVLLNGFVLAYRLALRRSTEGAVDSGISKRASEMAKLVCLRTEFPLFAADLRIDARIPQAVLELSRDQNLTRADLGLPGFSEEAFARAKAFAAGQLPTDEVITRNVDNVRNYLHSGIPDGSSDDDVDNSETAAEDGASDNALDVSDIIKSQARQLIAYLQRTQRITGPSRDLVFLESSGAAVGLTAELADELEQNAQNGATDAVVHSVAAIEPTEQEAAIHLLCYLVRESFGVEAENACHCLLEVVHATGIDLTRVVNDVLAALQAMTTAYSLEAGDLPGAFEISLLRSSETALALRRQVLARDEATTDEQLGLLILQRAADLTSMESELLGPVFAARLCASDIGPFFDAIRDLSDLTVIKLLSEQGEMIKAELAPEGDEDAASANEAAVTRIGGLSEHAVTDRPRIAPALLTLLLSLDSQAARNAAQPLLIQITPITDHELVRETLRSTAPRFTSLWRRWLEPLAPAAVIELEEAPKLIAALTPRIVTSRLAGENSTTDEDTSEAIRLLVRIRPTSATIPGDKFTATFRERAATPVTNNAEIDERLVLHRIAHDLAENELLSPHIASGLILGDVNTTLAQPLALDANNNRVPVYVIAACNLALPTATAGDSESVITAATNSPWLDGNYKNLIALYGRAVQRTTDENIEVPVTDEQVIAILDLGVDAAPSIASWLRAFKPSPNRMQAILGPWSSRQSLSATLQDSIKQIVAGWDDVKRRQLALDATAAFVHGEIGPSFMQSICLDELDPSVLAEGLADLFDSSANNVERERVMQLWRLIGPDNSNARRMLIDRVYIPLLRQGKGAVKIALDHFDLVRVPPYAATKDRVRAAINDGVRDDDTLKRRANGLLREANWTRRRRLFR
jgi:KAP family P-loop domain